MERCSSSLMATANGINRKRHISLDREGTNKSCKRVCVESFRGPMELASLSDFDNSWEAEPNVENNSVKTGIKTEGSTEWTCMKNKAHLVESELITNAERKSRHHSPATSESSIMALDSGKPGKPLNLHGVLGTSTNLLTELKACDEVPDPESLIELPPVPQYDACFGVVSHQQSSSGLKGCC